MTSISSNFDTLISETQDLFNENVPEWAELYQDDSFEYEVLMKTYALYAKEVLNEEDYLKLVEVVKDGNKEKGIAALYNIRNKYSGDYFAYFQDLLLMFIYK